MLICLVWRVPRHVSLTVLLESPDTGRAIGRSRRETVSCLFNQQLPKSNLRWQAAQADTCMRSQRLLAHVITAKYADRVLSNEWRLEFYLCPINRECINQVRSKSRLPTVRCRCIPGKDRWKPTPGHRCALQTRLAPTEYVLDASGCYYVRSSANRVFHGRRREKMWLWLTGGQRPG